MIDCCWFNVDMCIELCVMTATLCTFARTGADGHRDTVVRWGDTVSKVETLLVKRRC